MKKYVNFIGLGQCGMRICYEFSKSGYECTFINSDDSDVRGYDIEPEKVLVLKGTGTGKSLKIGAQIVEDNRSKFDGFVKKHCNKNGLTILVAGAGGGTGGSFVAPAAKLLKDLGYKTGVVITMPHQMLGMIPTENSLMTLKALKQIPLDLFLIADNDRLLDELGSTKTWWGKVNKTIVESVTSMFDILSDRKISREGLGSIDKGELIRCVTYGKGHTDVNNFYITPENFAITQKELEQKLFISPLVNGYNYKEGLCYAICVDIPTTFGSEHMDLANRIFALTKAKIGRGIAIPGMFTDPWIGTAVRVTLIVSGLGLPKILESRMKNLKRDAEAFRAKNNKVDNVLTEMDDMTGSSFDEDFSFK
jgi:cell division GTPase FtsZ